MVEALAQVAQSSGRGPIPGSIEGEVGRALHSLVQLKMSLLSAEGLFWVIHRWLPTQSVGWVYEPSGSGALPALGTSQPHLLESAHLPGHISATWQRNCTFILPHSLSAAVWCTTLQCLAVVSDKVLLRLLSEEFWLWSSILEVIPVARPFQGTKGSSLRPLQPQPRENQISEQKRKSSNLQLWYLGLLSVFSGWELSACLGSYIIKMILQLQSLVLLILQMQMKVLNYPSRWCLCVHLQVIFVCVHGSCVCNHF